MSPFPWAGEGLAAFCVYYQAGDIVEAGALRERGHKATASRLALADHHAVDSIVIEIGWVQGSMQAANEDERYAAGPGGFGNAAGAVYIDGKAAADTEGIRSEIGDGLFQAVVDSHILNTDFMIGHEGAGNHLEPQRLHERDLVETRLAELRRLYQENFHFSALTQASVLPSPLLDKSILVHPLRRCNCVDPAYRY